MQLSILCNSAAAQLSMYVCSFLFSQSAGHLKCTCSMLKRARQTLQQAGGFLSGLFVFFAFFISSHAVCVCVCACVCACVSVHVHVNGFITKHIDSHRD
jgi:hypothetical protein